MTREFQGTRVQKLFFCFFSIIHVSRSTSTSRDPQKSPPAITKFSRVSGKFQLGSVRIEMCIFMKKKRVAASLSRTKSLGRAVHTRHTTRRNSTRHPYPTPHFRTHNTYVTAHDPHRMHHKTQSTRRTHPRRCPRAARAGRDAREFRARETRHGGVARARSSETAGATRVGGDGDARAG